MSLVDRIMVPQRCSHPNPCEYVTLNGKRYYPGRSNVVERVLIRDRQQSQSQRGDVMMVTKVGGMHFEDTM